MKDKIGVNMKFCHQCGTELDSKARICNKCGCSLVTPIVLKKTSPKPAKMCIIFGFISIIAIVVVFLFIVDLPNHQTEKYIQDELVTEAYRFVNLVKTFRVYSSNNDLDDYEKAAVVLSRKLEQGDIFKHEVGDFTFLVTTHGLQVKGESRKKPHIGVIIFFDIEDDMNVISLEYFNPLVLSQ